MKIDNPDSYEHYRYHRILNRCLFAVLFVIWNFIVYFHFILSINTRAYNFIEVVIIQFALAVMLPAVTYLIIYPIVLFFVSGYKTLINWFLGY